MSLALALARVDQIERALSPPAPSAQPAAADPAVATASAASVGSFANVLQGALPANTTLGGTGQGGAPAIVAAAEGEVGQAEQPPGSNDSPRIAQYRQATAGSGVGPWCAYFVSWAARQAGVPLGDQGQGFGSVSAVTQWAQQSGKFYAPGTQTPQPGDLIMWGGRHIGIVESVDANGSIHTIEGNSSDRVSRRTYGPDGGGATGFARLG
jgi:CHAP domain